MNFCKKFSLYILILVVSLTVTGCRGMSQKVVFKRDSVYDSFQNHATEDAKPRRVGNVVYMGDSESTNSSATSDGPSFEFEKLRR